MQVLNIFHVLVAIALIAFVLVQRGQGATAGAAFGSGASGTVFGARGAGNFLSRSTWVLAALFCAISLSMAVLVSRLMETTEPDLGVVAGTQQVEQVEELPVPPVIAPSVRSDEDGTADLPAFESPAEDVPAMNSGAEGVPETGVSEDLPEPPPEDGN